jgi:hypothetical protein
MGPDWSGVLILHSQSWAPSASVSAAPKSSDSRMMLE